MRSSRRRSAPCRIGTDHPTYIEVPRAKALSRPGNPAAYFGATIVSPGPQVDVASLAQVDEQQTLPQATPLGQHLPPVVYPFRQSSAHLLPSHFAFWPGQHCSPHHFPSQQLPWRMFFGSQHVEFPTAPASMLFAHTIPGGQHEP